MMDEERTQERIIIAALAMVGLVAGRQHFVDDSNSNEGHRLLAERSFAIADAFLTREKQA